MKKSILAAAVVAASFAAVGTAMANPFADAAPAAAATFEPVPSASPYSFEIGLTAHQETYEEFIDGDKAMQEKGILYGLKAGLSRSIGEGAITLTGELAGGESKYTGSYMGGSYGDLTASGVPRRLIEVTAKYSHPVFYEGLTLSGGLGYRHLTDNLNAVGHGGYKRTNSRLYMTVGLDKTFQLNNNWNLVPGIEYKHILSGKQKADLDGGISLKQNDGYGVEARIAIVNKGDKFNTVITPYYRIWNVQKSDTNGAGYYEPKNKTSEIGLSLTVRF